MTILTNAVLIYALAVAGIPKSFGLARNDCRRPDGSEGECIAVRECEPVIKILQAYINSSPPPHVYDDLRKLQCGKKKVCCAKKQKSSNLNELLPLDTCGKSGDDNKVAFGNKTDLFQYPWMAQLAYKTDNGVEYLCGGTLITDRYVLTAGHCVPRYGYRKLIYVRLGEHDMSSPIDCHDPHFGVRTCATQPQDIEIESKIFHPQFNRVELLNDIALLRLTRKANTSVESVKPICLPVLPTVRHAILSKVTVTGWGLTEKNKRSNILLQGVVGIMDKGRCKKIYRNNTITEAHICIGDDTNVGSCGGDSGGPIQNVQDFNGDVRYVQYGVVSQGPSTCGADGLPGIHARIEFYLDWILSNIKP